MPKLDDISWHLDSVGDPEATAESRAALHVGVFVSWAIESGRWKGLPGMEELDLGPVRQHKVTGIDFLLEQCDGKLYSEMLQPEAEAFATDFYKKGYLRLYSATLREKGLEQYKASHSWQLQDELLARLEEAFQARGNKPWWRFW